MTRELQQLLLSAAIVGLTAGAAGCGSSPSSEPAGALEAKAGKGKAKHQAAGHPAGEATAADATQPAAPAAHTCAGKNECKGQGGCKVAGQNDCKGQNPCKGKGGCGMG
jgi:hypothetical protein